MMDNTMTQRAMNSQALSHNKRVACALSRWIAMAQSKQHKLIYVRE